MTACIEVSDVEAILPGGNSLTETQIAAAMLAAKCTVEQIATGCAAHLSSTCLAQVEIYLAAHFCAVTDVTLNIKSEKDACCGGSAVYGWELGEGIKGTPFGQMANTLSGGCLAELDKTPANFFTIGSH